METNPYVIDYYNNYDEDSRLNPRHETMEFLTTTRYIEKYIKPGNRVLEIRAGIGRYLHALTRLGYTVDAVELVPHNIEVFCGHMLPAERITITQGNALDLSAFSDNQYSITLLLGSLHHLYTKKDKCQVLDKTVRVTEQGGIIFAAYVIFDGCPLGEGFNRGNVNAAEYIENDLLDPKTFATKSEPKDLFELVHKEDTDDLISIFSVTRLHYAASDGCALLIRETVDRVDNETFQLYLKYHYAACERKDLTDITSHAINIFQKQTACPKASPKTDQPQ